MLQKEAPPDLILVMAGILNFRFFCDLFGQFQLSPDGLIQRDIDLLNGVNISVRFHSPHQMYQSAVNARRGTHGFSEAKVIADSLHLHLIHEE